MSRLHDSEFTLAQLQHEIAEWARHNFPTAEAHRYWPLLGMTEETGELAEPLLIAWLSKLLGKISHGQLKIEQGIRGNPEQLEKEIKDAIADLFIFCAHFVELRGWDLQDIVWTTWERVNRRDWQKDPETGGET